MKSPPFVAGVLWAISLGQVFLIAVTTATSEWHSGVDRLRQSVRLRVRAIGLSDTGQAEQ